MIVIVGTDIRLIKNRQSDLSEKMVPYKRKPFLN